MGKYKNSAYGCWEMWQANRDNPDWERIGQENGVSAKLAEELALGWDLNIENDEPTWIG